MTVAPLEAEYARGRQDGILEEGARVLGRIRDAIASWGREPCPPEAGIVIAALEVLSTCITHRGVTREDAIKAALKSNDDRKAAGRA